MHNAIKSRAETEVSGSSDTGSNTTVQMSFVPGADWHLPLSYDLVTCNSLLITNFKYYLNKL